MPRLAARSQDCSTLLPYNLWLQVHAWSCGVYSTQSVCDIVSLLPAAYARGGVLGMSVITFLGLAKLNLFGPGITGTVKSLWGKPDKK